MNPLKILLSVVLFSSFILVGCKKEKKVNIDIQPIDFQIVKNKAIHHGELSIYPIISNTTTTDDAQLTFAEAVKTPGFNIRSTIVGYGSIPPYSTNTDIVYFANKSQKNGLLLMGEIAEENNQIYISKESAEITKKRITDVEFITLERYHYTQDDLNSLTPIFPCPPTPLRDLIQNRDNRAKKWLLEALELMGYSTESEAYKIEIGDFEKKEIDEPDFSIRQPQDNLGEEEDFAQKFSPIGQNNQATGCLVTYKDTILLSYVFAQADLFQKEWSKISMSIYLNQLMGFKSTEMKNYRPFLDVKTSTDHIQKLWHKNLVLPQDHAHRGESNNQPFYLVWF